MATQAAAITAIRAAIIGAGLAVPAGQDPGRWPSWALNYYVSLQITSEETGGIGGRGVDVTRSRLDLFMLTGNPFDAATGAATSATKARLLRTTIEALGDSIDARFIYEGMDRQPVDGGLWLIRVTFELLQSDTYP